MFTRAIVRRPAPNFADGLTTAANLGVPDYARAMLQHEAYCAALERCGLALVRLGADSNYPDSTFVEDAAVITHDCAVLTRPGAPSRLSEIAQMRETLQKLFSSLFEIQPPG